MYKYNETRKIDKLIIRIENETFYSQFVTSLAKAAIRLTEFKQEKK